MKSKKFKITNLERAKRKEKRNAKKRIKEKMNKELLNELLNEWDLENKLFS